MSLHHLDLNLDDEDYLPVLPRHLLNSNAPPSDDEASAIGDIVSAVHAQISALDTTITRAEEILEELRKRKRTAIELLNHAESILSPVRRLPADVWGEIFAWTIPDAPRPGQRVIERSPWVFGRVCSQWRETSISLPTLWIHINSNVPPAILTAQLQRSKACGLSINLTYSDTEHALRPLLEHAERWETVDLQMGVIMLPVLEEGARGRMDKLRCLKYGDSTGVGTCHAFEDAPRLESVITTGKALLCLPWPQITHLRQRIPNVDGIRQLSAAHRLVELTLTNSVPLSLSLARESGFVDASPIELSALRTLLISSGVFLDFLTLPTLEDIYISHHAAPLLALMDRSSCLGLRSFAAEDMFSHLFLIQLFERTPALEELRLVSLRDTASLLTHLTSVPTPVPNLRTLALFDVRTEIQCALLVNFAQSRSLVAATNGCTAPALRVHILNITTSTLGVHALEAREKIQSLGVDIEWLPTKLARHRFASWISRYP